MRMISPPMLLGAAALVMVAGSAPVAAQSFDTIRSWFTSPGGTTGTVPAQPAPQEGGQQAPREWTGEDGASGHPLMRASAIRAAAANFGGCIEEIWPLAQRRKIPRALFDQLLAGVTPDLRIMDLLDSQPEFNKAPWEYLDILVTDARIADGRAVLAKYDSAFDAMEMTY
jgi:membrane-bound lytic murein transglycosylase B